MTDLSNHGRQKAAEIRCVPILLTLSHGTPQTTAKTTLRGVTSDRRPLQCPEVAVIGEVNTEMASHGSQATTYLGPSKGTPGALGRRMPSNAGMCALIITDGLGSVAHQRVLISLLQPYRAQGAAIAVEDAAVLGALLSYVSSLSQVPTLLQAYQELR